MGMVVAIVVAVPLGLLATSTLTWRGIVHERATPVARWLLGVLPYGGARALLSVFRSIPEYVWALMFVRAVGLGPFAGVLALGVAYGGMLGKVYSEILEGVDPRPVEALHAAGSRAPGLILYGLVPGALPHVVSYTLYRWECAIRASAIMGFVGAGGLGQRVGDIMAVLSHRGGPGGGRRGGGTGASGARDAALALRRGEAQPICGHAWGPPQRSRTP